jgi:hypothetical protein
MVVVLLAVWAIEIEDFALAMWSFRLFTAVRLPKVRVRVFSFNICVPSF